VLELAHKKTADLDGRARGKWRGPGAAACHSQSARVNTSNHFISQKIGLSLQQKEKKKGGKKEGEGIYL